MQLEIDWWAFFEKIRLLYMAVGALVPGVTKSSDAMIMALWSVSYLSSRGVNINNMGRLVSRSDMKFNYIFMLAINNNSARKEL